jgi:proteasome lid subunit RPN8/RPN11
MELIREINENVIFESAKDIYNYLSEFKNQDREHLIVIGLDSKNKPIYREVVTIGILNCSLIHPREIFKKAIMMSCNSIVIAHNHPSNDTEPSKEDLQATENLVKAGELLQIKVLDHLIITNDDYKSIIWGVKMAKAMKSADKKNYQERTRKNFKGDYIGNSDMSDRGKYLIIKYDFEHGIPLTESKKKFMEDFEKNVMIDNL